jgi:hypothetical protein
MGESKGREVSILGREVSILGREVSILGREVEVPPSTLKWEKVRTSLPRP